MLVAFMAKWIIGNVKLLSYRASERARLRGEAEPREGFSPAHFYLPKGGPGAGLQGLVVA